MWYSEKKVRRNCYNLSIYYYFRLLAEGNLELSREFLSLGVIEHLLFALGNHEHTDAQVQASLALEVQNMSTYTDGHILYTNTVNIHVKVCCLVCSALCPIISCRRGTCSECDGTCTVHRLHGKVSYQFKFSQSNQTELYIVLTCSTLVSTDQPQNTVHESGRKTGRNPTKQHGLRVMTCQWQPSDVVALLLACSTVLCNFLVKPAYRTWRCIELMQRIGQAFAHWSEGGGRGSKAMWWKYFCRR